MPDGFMGGLTLTTTANMQAIWMLPALTDVALWARMKFKAGKSRSLIIKKGKTTDRFSLRVQNEEIHLITKSQKCIGNGLMQVCSTETTSKGLIVTQVEDGPKKINRSNLPVKYKAWLYQHALLPRLYRILRI